MCLSDWAVHFEDLTRYITLSRGIPTLASMQLEFIFDDSFAINSAMNGINFGLHISASPPKATSSHHHKQSKWCRNVLLVAPEHSSHACRSRSSSRKTNPSFHMINNALTGSRPTTLTAGRSFVRHCETRGELGSEIDLGRHDGSRLSMVTQRPWALMVGCSLCYKVAARGGPNACGISMCRLTINGLSLDLRNHTCAYQWHS
jgi:hypothetical protein